MTELFVGSFPETVLFLSQKPPRLARTSQFAHIRCGLESRGSEEGASRLQVLTDLWNMCRGAQNLPGPSKWPLNFSWIAENGGWGRRFGMKCLRAFKRPLPQQRVIAISSCSSGLKPFPAQTMTGAADLNPRRTTIYIFWRWER